LIDLMASIGVAALCALALLLVKAFDTSGRWSGACNVAALSAAVASAASRSTVQAVQAMATGFVMVIAVAAWLMFWAWARGSVLRPPNGSAPVAPKPAAKEPVRRLYDPDCDLDACATRVKDEYDRLCEESRAHA
jgi:hypothetical protein